ncbi:MAG TPA: polyprenyl synthetase family protein [Candidatus Dormibacteraeota bacterium]|nr:polyprenyl synthetase family protein [Candidatus Dormibacteraeota bacterium]
MNLAVEADGIAGPALERLVEQELQRQLALDPEWMRDPMRELVEAGGKRLRPLLTMLCAQLGPDHDPGRSARLAAALELIHSATLVHDDIIDGAAFRRGRPTVNRSRGGRVAIGVGDYYFARAAETLAELNRPAVTATVLSCVRDVCRAQILETTARAADRLDEAVYVEIAAGKTAALLVAACAGGAQLSEAPPAVVAALRAYAADVGLAFQMVDDVIDFEPGPTGKPAGQDLRAGVRSLPLILACAGPGGDRLTAALRRPEALDRAVDLVRASGALEATRARARALADRAIAALGAVRPGPVRDRLAELADGAVERRA